ncbi:mucin-binding protein [Lactobacillus sp. PV012]|uniref:mucin-binding protein n=1 Tax=Lactobacillus sp. PV012 TaxID=2594494 RepID=UPI00223F33C6|nr:YSIRK-type signal peptide-containing protein [Lactobacillus sp. PV012]QNQ81882.1 YSIRK-type signal peptide-containing protein [Lactobacillus sp. PV012]
MKHKQDANFKNKLNGKQESFSLRKYTVGLCSVLLGTTFFVMGNGNIVHAETVAPDSSTAVVESNAKPVSKESTKEDQDTSLNSEETTSQETNLKSTGETNEKVNQVATQEKGEEVTEQNNQSKTETGLTSSPLYTEQNQVPELNLNELFTQEQLAQYGDDASIAWTEKPDVSKIGNTNGTAKLTYEDMDADTPMAKDVMVDVPVLVRKAEQEVKENQVKNSLNIINTDNNSLVAHYEWVGDKAKNEDEEESLANRDAVESNFNTTIEGLGFELDDESEFPEDLMSFGTANKVATVFVHPISETPIISDAPYFENGEGDSTIDNIDTIPSASSYIGNLGALPVGTTIEWKVAPTYDYTKDEDGDYVNPEPTNDPSIKVTIPGKDPIILDSNLYGDSLKEIATLPADGNDTLLLKSDNELKLGASVDNDPSTYVTNLDSFIKNYLENSGEEVNADNIQNFKDSFKWTILPNTEQAGYTFGVFDYNDGNVGNLILFKVNPNKVENSKNITRTITFEGLPKDITPKSESQIVTFTQDGNQTYVDEPIAYKSNNPVWEEYSVPEVKGYTPDKVKVPLKAVKFNDKNDNVVITYTANEHTRKINFVDPTDKTVGTQTVSGKTGTSVTLGNNSGDTPLNIPSGYEIVPNTEVPTNVPFNADNKDNGDITVHVQAKVDTVDGRHDKSNSDYRQVTRTITVNIEGQKPQVVTQTLDFYRTKSTNEVTGEVTYTDWTSNMTDNSTSFPEVEIPSAGGYTRTITGGEITTKDGKDYVAAHSGLKDGTPVR